MLKLSLTRTQQQTLPFKKIVVVAWGTEISAIAKETSHFSLAEITEGGTIGNVSTHRNIGLERIRSMNPDYVAFVDDDTFLNDTWHEYAMQTAIHTVKTCSIGGVITFASNWTKVQSCGHLFSNYRPLDISYGVAQDEIVLPTPPESVSSETFTCPCANSAFVPWTALECIHEIDGCYWDEKFSRMTCFEFGFKMHRLGYGYVLAPGALATHNGYLHRKNLRKEDIYDQIFSRIMLYRKFLADAECVRALADLGQRVIRWATNGYPHSPLSGEEIVHIHETALNTAGQHQFNKVWTGKIVKPI